MPEALHLRIEGRVQGVGYRAALTREAARLHLAGWVRNRADGSVEALAVGSAEALAALQHWARQGPPAAQVSAVLATPADPASVAHVAPTAPADFRQLPTV